MTTPEDPQIDAKQPTEQVKMHFRWARRLHTEFVQFVIDSQFTRLLHRHSLQSISTPEWTQHVLTFYDYVLNYFLQESTLFARYGREAVPHFIVVQDDQFRLEIKQYFPAEPLQLQVIQAVENSINNSKIQLFYNRQINVFGFLLHNYLAFVKDGLFQTQQNLLLPLYLAHQDPLNKYLDNRVQVAQIIARIPKHYYLHRYDFKPLVTAKHPLASEKLEPLNQFLADFLILATPSIPHLKHLFTLKPDTNQVFGNSDQIIAQLVKSNLMGVFIIFIQQSERGGEMRVTDQDFKFIDRQIQQAHNYDLNFDLRMLLFLYKEAFGFNQAIQKAKTPNDFFNLIPANLVAIMQERLRLFKSQLTKLQINQCAHLELANAEFSLQGLSVILNTYSDQIPDQKRILVQLTQESFPICVDFMTCRQCSLPIMCYHSVLDNLFQQELISDTQYNTLIEPFQTKDMSVFRFSSYCAICGASFPEKIDLIQVYENIDPLKKYKVIEQTFRILFVSVITSFQFKPKYFQNDFLQHYYYILKEELKPFKQNTNYAQKKRQITFLFVAAYLQSLKGDNVFVDAPTQFKYSQSHLQMKGITFEQFNTQVQQLRDKFDITSSIIIPSMTTVQHLYNSQLKKPIIGSIIRANPDILTQLLKKQIPIYPELYQVEKYAPYFNHQLDSLAPESIPDVVNACAVDIKARPSQLVLDYQQVKLNYGRHMERNTNNFTGRYIPVDVFLFKHIPPSFNPLHFKDVFYQQVCPLNLKPHDESLKCSLCSEKTQTRISDDTFRSHFYKLNGLPPLPSLKYPEAPDPLTPIFPLDYSDKYLISISKTLQVSYFQVANFAGFNYVDLGTVAKFQTLEQLVRFQIQFYSKITHHTGYNPQVRSSPVPKDLAFVNSIQANWNVFRYRLDSIINTIQTLLQSLAQNPQILDILTSFTILSYEFKRKGTTNCFLDCQILVNYLFKHLIPKLETLANPQLLKMHLNQMFKNDLIFADRYSELGAFRHKQIREFNVEKAFDLIRGHEDADIQSDDEKEASPHIDSDQDNDYVDGLQKNTIYDEDYDD